VLVVKVVELAVVIDVGVVTDVLPVVAVALAVVIVMTVVVAVVRVDEATNLASIIVHASVPPPIVMRSSGLPLQATHVVAVHPYE